MMKTLIIVPNGFFCERLRREIAQSPEGDTGTSLENANPDFYVTSPGQPMMGRRFANVMISEETYRNITRGNPHSKQWLEENILHKVPPGKRIIILP